MTEPDPPTESDSEGSAVPAPPRAALDQLTDFMRRHNVGRLNLSIEAVDVTEDQLEPTPIRQVLLLDPDIVEDETPAGYGLNGVFIIAIVSP